MSAFDTDLILVRGAGEHATGTAHRLYRAGFRVVMTELARPLVVRRTVAFATAVLEGRAEVAGVEARHVTSVPSGFDWAFVPVIVDPECVTRRELSPRVLVDARLLKRDVDTRTSDAPLVIGLGPGFTAGVHAHVVIETNRGHDLGALITIGEAEADTGVPGSIGGYTHERCLRAPAKGLFQSDRHIGEVVEAGAVLGTVAGIPLVAPIGGMLRGLLTPGLPVSAGAKLGDIDPRARREHCFTLSDKTRAISGGVLEAILAWRAGRL